MSRALHCLAVGIVLLMAGCEAVPIERKGKVSISPELASLYVELIKYENGLPSGALDPRTFASDDPSGYWQYVAGYETRKRKVYDRLYKRFQQFFPFPKDVNAVQPAELVQLAKKRVVLDELQRRFGISFYAMASMEWSSDQQLEYVRRNSDYGVTRMARWYGYDPDRPRRKRD